MDKPVSKSSLTGQSRKRKRENTSKLNHYHDSDSDSSNDDQSDDTIDEFASSEEKPLKRMFSSSSKETSLPKRFALPSMMSAQHRDEVGLSKLAFSNYQTSSSDSASASLLEQTPLDLSLEGSPGTPTNCVNGGVMKESALNLRSKISIVEEQAARRETTSSRDSQDEWCLTLDCSSLEDEDTPTPSVPLNHATPTSDVPQSTPVQVGTTPTPGRVHDTKTNRQSKKKEIKSKHAAATEDGTEQTPTEHTVTVTPRKLFQDNKSNTLVQKTTIPVEKTTTQDNFIDLTQEDDDEIYTPNLSLNNDHHRMCTKTDQRLRVLEPDVIIIDDSAQSSSNSSIPSQLEKDSDTTFYDDESSIPEGVAGSPLFLPPTPGREEVSSILQRRSIAFS